VFSTNSISFESMGLKANDCWQKTVSVNFASSVRTKTQPYFFGNWKLECRLGAVLNQYNDFGHFIHIFFLQELGAFQQKNVFWNSTLYHKVTKEMVYGIFEEIHV
jgi:hypothetical protein